MLFGLPYNTWLLIVIVLSLWGVSSRMSASIRATLALAQAIRALAPMQLDTHAISEAVADGIEKSHLREEDKLTPPSLRGIPKAGEI